MKAYKELLFILVITLTFGGCKAKEANTEVRNSATENASVQAKGDTIQGDFIYDCDDEIVYTNEQLEEIIATDLTKQELFQLYPTPYIREYGERTKFTYYSDSSVATVSFGGDNNRVEIIYNTFMISPSKEHLEQVKIGDSLSDVEQLDPNGFYNLVYYSNYPSQWISIHYTCDKYVIWIRYDDDNTVTKIDIESLKTRDGQEKIGDGSLS